MKKKSYIIFVLVSVFLVIGLSLFLSEKYGAKQADSAYPSGVKKLRCVTGNNVFYSSSTPFHFFPTTATTSCVIDITHVKNMSLGIYLYSTSSLATLNYTLSSSINDIANVPNVGPVATTSDWYRFKTYSDSGATRSWNTGDFVNSLTFSSSTHYHLLPVTDLRGQFLRIDYWLTAATGTAAIEAYADVD